MAGVTFMSTEALLLCTRTLFAEISFTNSQFTIRSLLIQRESLLTQFAALLDQGVFLPFSYYRNDSFSRELIMTG